MGIFKAAFVLFAAVSLISNHSDGIAEKLIRIQELRNQANSAWQEQVVDQYGRCIQVDVLPIIDEIEKVPILKMDSPIITENTIYNVFPREEVKVTVNDGTIDYEHIDEESGKAATMWIANSSNPTYPTKESLNIYIKYTQKIPTNVTSSSELLIDKGVYHTPNEIDLDASYLDGSDLTVRECLEIAERNLSSFFPDFDLKLDLFRFSIIDAQSPYYSLSIRQKVHGIPILTSAKESILNIDKNILGFDVPKEWMLSYNLPWGEFRYPSWELAISDSLFQIFCRPLKEGEVLCDDVPLCNMKDIIESIRTKILEGYIRNIYSLRFGYCCFYGRNQDIIVYPVWEIECDYMFTPNKEMEIYKEHAETPVTSGLYYRTMLVNAQTGEFIDPTIRKEELYLCPEIITYDDI